MKALMLTGERQLSLADVKTPKLSNHETLLNVEIAGIGGSEYLGFRTPGIRPLPNIMAHGFAGLANGKRYAVDPVSGCGECDHCVAGLRQLCDDWSMIGVQKNGGFAEYAVVPNDSLVELPDNISWEQAAFIEPFANSINAWSLASAAPNSRIAVLGSGSLGLGIIACAKADGWENIFVADLSNERLDAAKKLGAKALDQKDTFDIVFDTVGSVDTRELAINLTRKLGTTVWMGFADPVCQLNASALIRSQKSIIGSFAYSRDQFTRAISLVAHTDSSWVKNLGFDAVEGQLESFLANDFSTVKAALRPNRSE